MRAVRNRHALLIVTTLSTFFDVLSVLSVGGTSNSIAQMFD